MKPPRPVVTDVHHPSAGRAIPIQDVELPQGEVGILGPDVGHRADLPAALRPIDWADQPRGYTCRSRDPSSVAGHCFLSSVSIERGSSRPETHLQSGGAAPFFFAGRPRSLSVSFSKRIASLDLPKVKTSGGRGPFGSAIWPQFAGFATPPPMYPLDTSVPINTIRGWEITGNRDTPR